MTQRKTRIASPRLFSGEVLPELGFLVRRYCYQHALACNLWGNFWGGVMTWFKCALLAGAALVSSFCARAEGWSERASSYERSEAALKFLNESNARGYSDVGPYLCSYEGREIHYNGNTTLQLVNCLLEAPADARLLVITSAGGNVDVAMFGAHLVSEMKLDVEVVGLCGSSCANYILPAAGRVRIDPYSVVMVHGGPLPPDRDEMIEALAKSGFTSERPNYEQTIEDNLMRSDISYRLHSNFVKKFAVKPGYYHFDPVREYIAEQSVSYPFMLLDPYWLKACLPHVDIVADEPDRAQVEKLFPRKGIVFFSDALGFEGACPG